MRLSRENVRPRNIGTDAGRNAFKGKVILTTTVLAGALGACGDTYNHYGHDSTGPSDVVSCQSGPRLLCGDKPIHSYVRVGETLDVDETHFKVLEVGEDRNGNHFVLISIQDPDCNETAQLRVYRGESQELNSVFGNLKVSLIGIYIPDDGVHGAVLQVESNCPSISDVCSTSGLAAMGIINQGESLLLGSLAFLLDDLGVQNDGNYAFLSITQGENTLAKLKIKEGASAMISIDGQTYLITVKTIAPGYSFGAKWAEIEISYCNSE
ncbi:MAG: hypothetical protein ABH842_02980 [Candidatus Micrarchaeota archaeon]